MGLLDKTNPNATARSVATHAIVSMIVGAAFFPLFASDYQSAWRLTLPAWLALCGIVGALCEYQGAC